MTEARRPALGVNCGNMTIRLLRDRLDFFHSRRVLRLGLDQVGCALASPRRSAIRAIDARSRGGGAHSGRVNRKQLGGFGGITGKERGEDTATVCRARGMTTGVL